MSESPAPSSGDRADRGARRILAMGGSLLLAAVASTVLAAGAHAQSVGLGTADSFAVLGGSTVTNTGPTVVTGNLGVNPGSAVVGFPPGTVVGGTIHANDAVAAQAQADLTTAYNDAAGRSSTAAVPADLVGLTLSPGVYTAPTMELSGTLTLDGQGDPNAVFIFQSSTTLITASASRVQLIGSAQACNVFWQVGSSATLGTASSFVGNILALTAITMTTDATLDGRALARNAAVTLDTNAVTRSTCAPPPPIAAAPGTPGAPTPGAGTPGAPAPGSGTPGAPGPGAGDTGTSPPAATLPGIARWAPGPRTGPRRRPPIAGRCTRRPFTLRVTGRNIRQVSYWRGGTRLGTVRAIRGRTVFALRFDPRRFRTGVARITARVSFTSASDTRTRTLRLTYERCLERRPRFTG